MTKSSDKINQFIEQVRQVRLKFEAEGKQLITDALVDMFAEHRNLHSVEWTQYTPYFNDGDPCVFGVKAPDFHVSDEPEHVESFYASNWRADENRKKYGAELYDAATAFSELITSGELEHVLQGAFGDHVKITATRDGIDVEEYEHD